MERAVPPEMTSLGTACMRFSKRVEEMRELYHGLRAIKVNFGVAPAWLCRSGLFSVNTRSGFGPSTRSEAALPSKRLEPSVRTPGVAASAGEAVAGASAGGGVDLNVPQQPRLK